MPLLRNLLQSHTKQQSSAPSSAGRQEAWSRVAYSYVGAVDVRRQDDALRQTGRGRDVVKEYAGIRDVVRRDLPQRR